MAPVISNSGDQDASLGCPGDQDMFVSLFLRQLKTHLFKSAFVGFFKKYCVFFFLFVSLSDILKFSYCFLFTYFS